MLNTQNICCQFVCVRSPYASGALHSLQTLSGGFDSWKTSIANTQMMRECTKACSLWLPNCRVPIAVDCQLNWTEFGRMFGNSAEWNAVGPFNFVFLFFGRCCFSYRRSAPFCLALMFVSFHISFHFLRFRFVSFFRGCAVRMADLSRNRLAKVTNGAFVNLSNLTYLDLSYNKLVKLESATVEPLKKLHSLNISGNIQMDLYDIRESFQVSKFRTSFCFFSTFFRLFFFFLLMPAEALNVGCGLFRCQERKRTNKKMWTNKIIKCFRFSFRSIVASSPENVIDCRYGAYTVRAAGAARPNQGIKFVRKSFS